MCAEDMRVTIKLEKAREQETKTFTLLGEVGMANESTKTKQTSVQMAQHNQCMNKVSMTSVRVGW